MVVTEIRYKIKKPHVLFHVREYMVIHRNKHSSKRNTNT